jgi:hypothetical protein
VRTLNVGAIFAAAWFCDNPPRAVENSFDQSISYVSFVLATANDHERLARLSRSDGRPVRAKSALRLPPVTFLRLKQVFHDSGGIGYQVFGLLPLRQKLTDFAIDLCAVVLFGRAKLKVAVVAGKVVAGKGNNGQSHRLLDCGCAPHAPTADFCCVAGAPQNAVLRHGRELCAYAVRKVSGISVVLRGSACLFLSRRQAFGRSALHSLSHFGLVTGADNHAGNFGAAPLAGLPPRQRRGALNTSSSASDSQAFSVYVDKTGRDAATHVHLAVVVYWQFCKALSYHIFRFGVSWFNSHRHQHYTATPYNSQQLFSFFYDPKPQ